MDAISLLEVDPLSSEAQACLGAYYAELDRRFEGGFRVDQSHDPDRADLMRPRGAFLVAKLGMEAAGCVALKGKGGETGEIKRLWVAEPFRGQGLARRLMQGAETIATELGMRRLRLDTNLALQDAILMYRRLGWREIERFNDDPYAHVFFERDL